ncbi:MAG: FtsP/CotA-like multicopper oxidase with cupredoxin domain, partial [Verrucomicrobiales bacterium]
MKLGAISFPLQIVLATVTAVVSHARTVELSLAIAVENIEIAGESREAMTINGGVPGPVLRFREGDQAVIHVTNRMDEPTSIHWHGLLVPPDMDGVPAISFPPIAPGDTFTYRFPIRQAGTYWYHSHSGMQEQLGVYGSIVILPNKDGHRASRDHVVMLSDWVNENPDSVLRT